MSSPYTTRDIVKGTILTALFLGILNVYLIKQYDYSLDVAIKEAVINLQFWFLGALVIGNTIRHYFPQQNRVIFFAGLVIICTLAWSSGSYFLIQFVNRKVLNYDSFLEESFPIRIAFTLLLFGAIAILYAFLNLLDEQYKTEKNKTEMQRLAKETELNNLQEKLHPHFLFNSLNSINALVAVQPERARNMVQQLSDFLRSTLKRKNDEWISLKEELEYLSLYLDIEKVRFGHRLQTEIKLPSDMDVCRLPSFILLPIMENAIKFGLYDTLEDVTIRLNIRCENNMLMVEVNNPYDPATATKRSGTGYGLKAVNRRLYLLFGRNDLLITKSDDNIFFTSVYIPQIS